jgi:enolase
MSLRIRGLRAMEILDSRGNPTVEVECTLSDGTSARAQVPSGASTGRREALELRDADPLRFGGKGVLRAVANVETEIAQALLGADAEDQTNLDRLLVELDGTPGKSRLGANAILGVSCATARATAISKGIPLWQRLGEISGLRPCLPVPMVNIMSGGHHAGFNVELQDFLALPVGLSSFGQSLRAVREILYATKEILAERGLRMTGVADEGGWGPDLPSNEAALEVLTMAIERSGYRPGEQVAIAIDAAASHYHRDGAYHLQSEKRTLQPSELIDLYESWSRRFPIVSLEDGLDQDDEAGWRELTARLGSKMQVIGDDYLTTNPDRVRNSIKTNTANAVLVKMNQIGTLTETFEVVRLAAAAGWRAVVSARSGETEDSFLADLAVASGAGQIKVGSVTRSERLAKYNHLLWLERDSGLAWPGGGLLPPVPLGLVSGDPL